MELYCLDTVLYESPTLKTYEAWSIKYEKKVIVKVFPCSSIFSSECLLKEAVRQAREKPVESAALIDVAMSPDENCDTEESFFVNFVLEQKLPQVAKELIVRDDGRGKWTLGLSGYDFRRSLYAHEGKKVDLAYSVHLRREVVIKSKECFLVAEANSLLREAFALAFVEHPYNCRLIDICISKEAKFSFHINLVLEKFERDVSADIRDRMRRGETYLEVELLHFLRDVTCGLAHAKSVVRFTQNIAHRDIKPANIFINAEGKYKLGDFGSSWKKTRSTLASTAAGTELYMSPEMQQCMAKPGAHRVDAFLADVYSLGVTALHMAAQRLPLTTDPIRKEDVNVMNDEQIRQMVAADPILRTEVFNGGTRQRLIEMLSKNVLLGTRLNIIRSGLESLERINYSKGFKKLLRNMVAVDPMRRIRLDNAIRKIEDLLIRHEAPKATTEETKAHAAKPSRQSQIPTKLLGIDPGGELRLMDVQSTVWEAPLSHQMHIDHCTSYTFIRDTIAILCGSNCYSDWDWEGVEVYRLEFPKFAVSELPNFPAQRAAPGLLSYEGFLLAFGGKEYIR